MLGLSHRPSREEFSLKDLDTTPARNPSPRGHIVIAAIGREPAARYPVDYVASVVKAGGDPLVASTFPMGEVPEGSATPVIDQQDPGDASVLNGAVGLVLTGGGDIDPARYRRAAHEKTEHVSARRDEFEASLLESAFAAEIPVFAICRGMQLLNVTLGGALDQHLLDRPGRLEHWRDRPRAEPAHAVRVKEGSLLTAALGSGDVPVNSHHHQGLDRVADPLEEIAWADDGVLEAVRSRDHEWVVGVQWHPEAMALVDDRQLALFEMFVDATRTYARAGARSSRPRSA